MRIIFLGTPEFAVKPLKALIDAGHEVVGVVTQVDKVNARGNKVVFSPIKQFCVENNLKVYQFNSLRKEGVQPLKSLKADIMITASYGQILSQEIIDICKYGVLNIHGSILPKYRGASPVLQALLDGEHKTGVTIMKTDIGLDDGLILLKREVEIDDNDNQQTLMDKLSIVGAEAICEVLSNIDKYMQGAIAQDDSLATHCGKYSKDDAKLEFSKDANVLRNEIRAFYGNPTSYFTCDNTLYKVFEAQVVDGFDFVNIGEVATYDKQNGLVIKCGSKALKILQIQKQGGKILNIKDFMNGNKFDVGQILNQ